MKKYLFGALIALVTLTGCGPEEQARKNTMNLAEKRMNSNEIGMLMEYRGFKYGYREDYFPMLRGIVMTRNKRIAESAIPFCDVYSQLMVSENGIKNKTNKPNLERALISKQFEKVFDKSLRQACYPVKVTVPVSETKSKVQVTENVEVVKIDNEDVISPALYDELINSVGTCKRASIRVMELTDGNRLLTKKDYVEVNRIILNCKNAELNRKVNFE